MQEGANNKLRPVAYASRKLNRTEQNYSVTQQESLAVVWALKHFKDIIFGYQVHVLTDPGPVTELFKGKNLSGKLARWQLIIQDFNLTFQYLPGGSTREVTQVVIPASLVDCTLYRIHDSPEGGHPGTERCLNQSRISYYLP